nr:hypothetical protein [uncultured Desulfobacter sp.]
MIINKMNAHCLFTGASGKQYTFELYSKSAALLETGGIYILTYTHPRGHMAGVQINILDIGKTENFNLSVTGLQQSERLKDQCWNYNYVCCIDDPESRDACLKDLLYLLSPTRRLVT